MILLQSTIANNVASQASSATIKQSLVDIPGTTSYPIGGYAYIGIIPNNFSVDCSIIIEIYRFVTFVLTDQTASKLAMQTNMYVTQPDSFDALQSSVFENIYCNGQKVKLN